jgi:hypothetical protein
VPSSTADAATPGAIPLKVNGPSPVAPADGIRLDNRQPTLVVNNPTAPHAPVASLRLRFIVEGTDGATIHQSSLVTLGSGTTSYTVPLELDYDRPFRWFAEVVWNDSTGPASAARGFTTPEPPQPPAPQIELCPGDSPLGIVACQRARAPEFMDRGELVDFLRAIAVNLNANGIGGGPFGVLHKNSGNNCGGYSCDIICAGHGGSQRQWDVLLDIENVQAPDWAGPHDGDDIRADVCEIQ